jgi:riboflavin kinase/FMN adenylyltransferase
MSAAGTMRILHTPEGAALDAPVATVGNFDAVHRGHLAILSTVVARARALSGTAVVVTFHPHPQKVLHPDSAPRLICTRTQKLRLLEESGMDAMLEIPFTREFSGISPATFVAQVLAGGLGAREIHIGHNFRFGRDREGDFVALEEIGLRHGIKVEAVAGVRHDGERISSSRVRRALAGGEIRMATEMLGREPELEGKVVHGDGRGRTLGFPTANLEIENELVPLTGVYATRIAVKGRWVASVTNIGSRPTFPGATPAIETHLLGFSQDIYGESIRLRLVERLRDEMRFKGVEELKARIASDIEQAGRLLGRP